MRCTLLLGLIVGRAMAGDAYPPPHFADPQRVQKLESALPLIDALFRAYAADKKIPGMVWGVVIDARLAHTGTYGIRERESKAPVTTGTAFRIASNDQEFHSIGDPEAAG
jgi:CubicO group peptidase (beta-lactamase class C family)